LERTADDHIAVLDQAIEALRPKYCRRLLVAVDCAGVSEARPGRAPGQAGSQGPELGEQERQAIAAVRGEAWHPAVC
jgi:hypothetical protein